MQQRRKEPASPKSCLATTFIVSGPVASRLQLIGSAMPQPNPGNKTKVGTGPVTKNDYLSAASFLLGSDSTQRVSAKKDPNGEAVRATADLYGNREYVEAYERFKPAYENVMANMQRVLARNIEFEANKVARQQQLSLPAAKERVQRIRTHAQEVIDHFDRLFQD